MNLTVLDEHFVFSNPWNVYEKSIETDGFLHEDRVSIRMPGRLFHKGFID